MKANIILVYKALLAARTELDRQASLLNRINVFPVMDGDTGLNLRTTLNALPELSKVEDADALDVTLPLLRGACGNSGIILSQFLVGLFDKVTEANELTPSSFAQGVAAGRKRAYTAVSNPKEGTMLTVMTVLDSEIRQLTAPFTMADHRLLAVSLLGAVLDTPKQLPVLADAGVVDAGALGFYILATGLCLALVSLNDQAAADEEIEGWISGARGVFLQDIQDRILPRYINDAQRAGVGQRYCVNLLVEGVKHTIDKNALNRLGDSINIAQLHNIIKIHIHTDEPEAVKSMLSSYGRINQTVIQDMQRSLLVQPNENSIHSIERTPIRIMGDAGASLDPVLTGQLGIVRLHNHVNIAGKKVPDHEVDPLKLLSEMRDGAVFTTAAATPEDARFVLDRALESSESVVYIAVGDAYTPTRDTVEKERCRHPEGSRMVVLSSSAASGQQGLICVVTQQYASNNHTLDETVAYAERQIASCIEYLFIPDLTFLQRTGRIGAVKAAFAKALSIKPVIGHGPNGAITHFKVKNCEKAVETILSRVINHPGDGPLSVMVEYTDNIEFAESLRDRMISTLPEETDVFLAPLSSASVVHMGPGTWGVSVTRR